MSLLVIPVLLDYWNHTPHSLGVGLGPSAKLLPYNPISTDPSLEEPVTAAWGVGVESVCFLQLRACSSS